MALPSQRLPTTRKLARPVDTRALSGPMLTKFRAETLRVPSNSPGQVKMGPPKTDRFGMR
jgi:hypothetical protein